MNDTTTQLAILSDALIKIIDLGPGGRRRRRRQPIC